MIEIRKAVEQADFQAAHDLIALLAAWDVEQMQVIGLSTDDLVTLYYSDTVDTLSGKFGRPETPFLLGRIGGEPVGCAALFDAGDGTAEVHKMFVRPDYRGKGLAKALMTSLVEQAGRNGYSRLRLETVTFMTDAIRLYRTFGFMHCTPFHDVPESLRAITIFMERPI